MSAIFGVWHRDERPPASFGPQPTSGPLGVQVVFDGRLDNRVELLRMLDGHNDVSPRSSDADLVALAYAFTRGAFITHLHGDFSLAVYDARERRLVLARDAIGVRPLYYAATPSRIVFGSRIQIVLADASVQARPNDRLLAGLMLGHLHRHDDDGSTFFHGISSVPASHIATFDIESMRVEQYWEFDAHVRRDAMSFEDCAAELRAHLTTAVDRRLRGPSRVAIAVSGGLDSSALFCLAQQSAIPPTPALAFTYTAHDGSAADESAFVEELERLHGRIEHVTTASVGSVLSEARENIRRVEAPMLDLQSNRSASFMTAIARSGAATVMTGHWGDQLMFDQAYLVDAFRQLSWTTVREDLDQYLRWFPDARGDEFKQRFVSDVLDHAAPGWVRPAARRIRRAWRAPEWWQRLYTRQFRAAAAPDAFRHGPLHGDHATALCHALYREARSKYHALCLEFNSKDAAHYGLTMTFPFLDRDLVAFALSVPGPLLVRGGVPKALLREAVRGIVPEAIRTRRTKGDFSAIVNDAARREFADITRLLAGEPLVVQFGYVEVDTLIAGFRRAEQELAVSASSVATWRLADIVALELWLQEFFGGHQQVEDVRHA